MAAASTPAESDPSIRVTKLRQELRTQHRRYGIDQTPPQLARLELAVDRRNTQIAHLAARVEEIRADIERLTTEIAGYAKGLEALLSDEIDRIRSRFGESWSPAPVMGFRLWWLNEGRLEGARTVWTTPRMTAVCATTSSNPDEVPHSDGRCGRLGCGVYVTKDVTPLLRSFVEPQHRGYVVALVELHGKVVEHQHGYRGARAVVVAVAVAGRSRLVLSDHPALIDTLFRTPAAILEDETLGIPLEPTRLSKQIADYLSAESQRRDPWTSVSSNA